jgi:hypothetical protein
MGLPLMQVTTVTWPRNPLPVLLHARQRDISSQTKSGATYQGLFVFDFCLFRSRCGPSGILARPRSRGRFAPATFRTP